MPKSQSDEPSAKMKRKGYEKKLCKLQVELCKLQEWAVQLPKRSKKGEYDDTASLAGRHFVPKRC